MNRPLNGLVLDAAFVAHALAPVLRQRCGRHDARFERAVVDSRLVQPGDLFVALPGDHTDGHDFAAAAVRAGAAGCILARPVEGTEDAACFIVDDPLAALQRLAVAWRNALPGLRVVGVTGNVGKTTTKMLAAAVLAAKYRVQATPLNYNNEIGVPLCLLELKPGTQRAVIEMGMYTPGEIALLCRWTHPATGIVLNVGPVHLERAGSLEAIVRAKRELPEALPPEGHVCLNADDEAVRDMAHHTSARAWLFGTRSGVDVQGREVVSHGAQGFDVTITAGGCSRRVHVPLPGAHLVSNVLAAVTAALADGVPFDAACDALERLDVPSRLKVLDLPGGVTLLDDTYNANPASTMAALQLLSEIPVEIPGRRLALLGDMRELGAESEPQHERIGRRAAEVVDVLYTIGDLARIIATAAAAGGHRAVRHMGSNEEAVDVLASELREGDVVLIKGSHALGLEVVVERIVEALHEGRRPSR